MDQMLLRIPDLKNAEIRQLLNGAESFTPDMRPILGEAPNVCLPIQQNDYSMPSVRMRTEA